MTVTSGEAVADAGWRATTRRYYCEARGYWLFIVAVSLLPPLMMLVRAIFGDDSAWTRIVDPNDILWAGIAINGSVLEAVVGDDRSKASAEFAVLALIGSLACAVALAQVADAPDPSISTSGWSVVLLAAAVAVGFFARRDRRVSGVADRREGVERRTSEIDLRPPPPGETHPTERRTNLTDRRAGDDDRRSQERDP